MTTNKHNDELKERQMLENGTIGTLHQGWTPKVVVNAIALVPERAGWTRKGVITNYPRLPLNYQNHVAAGYQLVYSLESMTDERKFGPNSNASTNTVPSPVTHTTADGYHIVLMEIEDHKLMQFKDKEAKESDKKYKQSVKSQNRKGNQLHTDGGEIDFK
jgi:hypothetical protein